LGEVLSTVAHLALDEMHQLPGVDYPDEWDEEGVEEEHDGLLLHHSIGLTVDIVEGESLHEQRHQRSCKEQTKGVLQTEGEFILSASAVHFDVGEEMEYKGEYELVEEGDGDHGEQGGREGGLVQLVDVVLVIGVLHLLDRLLHSMALRPQYHEEDAGDDGDGGEGHRPSQDQPEDSALVAVVDVLPDDLAGLGGHCHLDVHSLHSEVLDQLVLVDLLELLEEFVADLLAVEDDDGLLTDDVVLGDEPDLLLVLLLQLLLLLLQFLVDLCDLPHVLLGPG
jgi:hypothetical protein